MSDYERNQWSADGAAAGENRMPTSRGSQAGGSDPSYRTTPEGSEPPLLARVPDLDAGCRSGGDIRRPAPRGVFSQRMSKITLIGGGSLLLLIAVGAWVFDRGAGPSEETDAPKWEVGSPAPDAPIAPPWTGATVAENPGPAWQEPGAAVNPVIPAVPSYNGAPVDAGAAHVPSSPAWDNAAYPAAESSPYPTAAETSAVAEPAGQPGWQVPPGGYAQGASQAEADGMRVIAPPPSSGQAPGPQNVLNPYPGQQPAYETARTGGGYYNAYAQPQANVNQPMTVDSAPSAAAVAPAAAYDQGAATYSSGVAHSQAPATAGPTYYGGSLDAAAAPVAGGDYGQNIPTGYQGPSATSVAPAYGQMPAAAPQSFQGQQPAYGQMPATSQPPFQGQQPAYGQSPQVYAQGAEPSAAPAGTTGAATYPTAGYQPSAQPYGAASQGGYAAYPQGQPSYPAPAASVYPGYPTSGQPAQAYAPPYGAQPGVSYPATARLEGRIEKNTVRPNYDSSGSSLR